MGKVRITESELRQIIRESVEEVLGIASRGGKNSGWQEPGQQGYEDFINAHRAARKSQRQAYRAARKDQRRAYRAANLAQKRMNGQRQNGTFNRFIQNASQWGQTNIAPNNMRVPNVVPGSVQNNKPNVVPGSVQKYTRQQPSKPLPLS